MVYSSRRSGRVKQNLAPFFIEVSFLFDWLRRLFRKHEKVCKTESTTTSKDAVSSSTIAVEDYKHKIQVDRETREERIRELNRKIAEHERRIEELKHKPFKFTPYTPSMPRQPASQTYTSPRRKIRGMKPRSARNKRMWKLRVSKEEIEKDEGD